MAATDFKSYKEYPFWIRAFEQLRPTRASYPHQAGFFEAVNKRMQELIDTRPLPLPPPIKKPPPLPLPPKPLPLPLPG